MLFASRLMPAASPWGQRFAFHAKLSLHGRANERRGRCVTRDYPPEAVDDRRKWQWINRYTCPAAGMIKERTVGQPMSEPNPNQAGNVEDDEHSASDSASNSPIGKFALLLVLVLILIVVFTQFREYLTLESLAARESQLRDFQARNPYFVYGVAFLVYVAVTGLSIPGATALTLVYGWYFNFLPALILISFASTAGATVAFLVSRFLLRDTVQDKFGDRLTSFHHHLETEGAFYLFTLRLIPAVPFFVINLVMGLTPLKTRTYWWVSQLGMLPGTVVYVYAGSRVPNLTVLAEEGASAVFSPSQLTQLAIAFAMLGLFPLVVKKILNRFTASRSTAAADSADS